MKSKTNNTKVAKPAKTKLSDMRPKKDAQGGGPGRTAPVNNPPGTAPIDPPQGGKGVTL